MKKETELLEGPDGDVALAGQEGVEGPAIPNPRSKKPLLEPEREFEAEMVQGSLSRMSDRLANLAERINKLESTLESTREIQRLQADQIRSLCEGKIDPKSYFAPNTKTWINTEF